MNRIILISILMTLFAACTPQMNSLKQASCGDGHYFDEITRSCLLDVSPKAPVVTTTSLTIAENTPKTAYTIDYTDQNGNSASSCTVVNSDVGLNQIVELGSVQVERNNTWFNAINYPELYLQFIDSPSVTVGNEIVDFSAGNTITVYIDSGVTTSNHIITAINADPVVGPMVTASVVGPNAFENSTPAVKIVGASCECVSGVCSMEIEPSRNLYGLTFVDFYITDSDGDSAINRLSIDVTNVNQAPIVVATRSMTVPEDDVISFEFDAETDENPVSGYFDYDGDFATFCSANSIHPSVQNSNISCSCVLGKCTLNIITDNNYFNTVSEDLVEYQLYANGQFSNVGIASARITSVDDDPIPGAIITKTVDEDATAGVGAQTLVNFNFPAATDDAHNGFPASDLRFKLKNLTSYADIQGSCTGAPGNTNPLSNVDIATSCTVQFEGDANGVFTLEYQISDTMPVTSMSDFHSTGYIKIIITPQNDPPVVASGPLFTHTMNESSDWNPVSDTISLGTVSDVDSALSSLSVYFIDGSGNQINTMAGQSTVEATAGTISDCAIDTSGNITCLYTTLTGNSSTSVGIPDALEFVVKDADGATSEVYDLEVTVLETSDAPVLCNYSKYNRRAERIECGVNDCIGEGAPNFLPSSHDGDDPVIYFDRQEGLCYQSTSKTNWEIASNNGVQNASYVKDVVIGEKEEVIIDNLILSEGGRDVASTQSIRIQNIVSTNNILIRPENIHFMKDTDLDGYYDDIDVDGLSAGAILDSSISMDEKFRIRMVPTASQFGETTISFDLVDTGLGTPSTSISFKVRVEQQTIKHHGWADVKALGTKVNHFGIRVEPSFTCSQSLTKCDGGKECYGLSDPSNSVTPDAAGAIYRTSTNKCYYSTGTASSDWVLINKSVACNISEVNKNYATSSLLDDDSTTCDDLGSASCIGDATYDSLNPNLLDVTFNSTSLTLNASDNAGKFFFNTGYQPTTGLDCFYSDGTNWMPYHGTSKVSLEWEDFTVDTTGAITGYNIYRKRAGAENKFNYSEPLNRELITSGTTYVDNGENSRLAPVPNHTYVYEVRPVLSFTNQLSVTEELEVTTNNNVAKIKVIAPQENFSFVHRWMINKKMCETLHSDPAIDSNYECSYIGYGDKINTGGNPVFDISKDLLVPRFEMGCPYTKSGCTTSDGQCVAQNLGTVDGSDGDLFYERSTGSCYLRTAGAWNLYNGETLDTASAYQAFLPPLTNINYTQASLACAGLSASASTVIGYNAVPTFKVPTRNEQIGYSSWDVRSTSDSNIEVTEKGLSLNSTSKCNASYANGLEDSFMDVDNLSSSDIHSLPGTYSSGIRSLHTGSDYTENCTSMFGIQDSVGNVAEFSSTEYGFDNFIYNFAGISSSTGGIFADGGNYAMNGEVGPCHDYNSATPATPCGDELENYLYEDVTLYSTKYFNPVYGISITNIGKDQEDIINAGVANANDYNLRIGSTSGITNSQLHDDGFFRRGTHLDDDDLFAATKGVMVSGGGYASGTAAGVYGLELLPVTDANTEIGVRCVIEIDPSNYVAE